MTKLLFNIILINLSFIALGCQTHDSIDSYLTSQFEKGKLNGNILIIKDGKKEYEKSFGYSDASRKNQLTKDYRFNIGSVYKEFPAVAIMQLQEQNKLEINDKLSKYLSQLPAWAEKISIKHLLQYSSGLPRVAWGNYFGKGLAIRSEDVLNDLKETKSLAFTPGASYLYTNYSPILLISVVEKISGIDFSQYVQENLFTPFNIRNTVIKEGFPYADQSLMAMPFDEHYVQDDYKIQMHNLLFSATANDLAIWLQQIGDFNIITKSSVKFLSEKAIKGDNIQAPLGRGRWVNNKFVGHSHHGSSGNYECVVRRFKEERITIIILTNQKHGNVFDMSDDLYDLIKK